jgi:hypothetical protein
MTHGTRTHSQTLISDGSKKEFNFLSSILDGDLGRNDSIQFDGSPVLQHTPNNAHSPQPANLDGLPSPFDPRAVADQVLHADMDEVLRYEKFGQLAQWIKNNQSMAHLPSPLPSEVSAEIPKKGKLTQHLCTEDAGRIIGVTEEWTDPVTMDELHQHPWMAKTLRHYIHHQIDLEAALDVRKKIADSIRSERSYAIDLESDAVTAKVLGDYEDFLENKIKMNPLIRRQCRAAIGQFIWNAKVCIGKRMNDKTRRFIHKQIDNKVDINIPQGKTPHKRFERAEKLHEIMMTFGEIYLNDPTVAGCQLEDSQGGKKLMRRILGILDALGVGAKWRSASAELLARSEPTSIDIAMTVLIGRIPTILSSPDCPIEPLNPNPISPQTDPMDVEPQSDLPNVVRKLRPSTLRGRKHRIEEDDDHVKQSDDEAKDNQEKAKDDHEDDDSDAKERNSYIMSDLLLSTI